MSLRLTLAGLLALSALAVAVGPSLAADAPPAAAAAGPARVRTARVHAAPSHRDVVLHGITRATDRGALGFTVSGRLGERRVDVGDTVQKGEVLAVLDTRPYANADRAARATVTDLQGRLSQLERDRERLEVLGRSQSVAEAELERIRTDEASVRANLDAAGAQAAEAGRQLGEAVLRAPFDGVVALTLLEPGEAVAAGAPILALSGSAGTEVEVQVPERIWARLQPGAGAHVELPATGEVLPAAVTHVGRSATAGGLFPVVVAVEGGVAAGLTARVALPVPLEAAWVVPLDAVVDPTGTSAGVYRVSDDVVERVAVHPDALLDDGVAVSGELSDGDVLVIAGHARLLDGDRVEVSR